MSAVREHTPSQVALRFFVAAALAFCGSGAVALVLMDVHRARSFDAPLAVPPAFLVSSLLLVGASLTLGRSLSWVRIERQRPFRRSLLAALVLGALFVGVQTYGLNCLLENQRIRTGAASEHAFTFVLTALHALHVTVALLFLSFVTVRALADRYDHEYYWGVTCCAWFWHMLGLVWLGILAVFAIAA